LTQEHRTFHFNQSNVARIAITQWTTGHFNSRS
jgi:hypothetical protein